jgi:predicted transcriptional regulator
MCYVSSMSTVNISFRIDKKKAAKLDSLAKASDRSRTEVIDEALESHFFLHELNMAKIDAGIKDADEGQFATDAEVKAEFARWRGSKQ